MSGLRAPGSVLDLPGITSDYSNLLNWGNSGYSPIGEYSVGTTSLPAQIGPVGSGSVGGGGGWFSGFGDTLRDSGFLGSFNKDTGVRTDGWGGMAFGAIQGIGNLINANRQYDLGKKAYKQGVREFNLNYGAQKATTNAALADRQAARIAGGGGNYQSVSDYMRDHGVA